jgi:hypothetical protein
MVSARRRPRRRPTLPRSRADPTRRRAPRLFSSIDDVLIGLRATGSSTSSGPGHSSPTAGQADLAGAGRRRQDRSWPRRWRPSPAPSWSACSATRPRRGQDALQWSTPKRSSAADPARQRRGGGGAASLRDAVARIATEEDAFFSESSSSAPAPQGHHLPQRSVPDRQGRCAEADSRPSFQVLAEFRSRSPSCTVRALTRPLVVTSNNGRSSDALRRRYLHLWTTSQRRARDRMRSSSPDIVGLSPPGSSASSTPSATRLRRSRTRRDA